MPTQFEYETARALFAELVSSTSMMLADTVAAGLADPLVGGLITLHTHRAMAELHADVEELLAALSAAQTKSGRRVQLIDEHVAEWSDYRQRQSDWIDASYHHGVAAAAHILDPRTYPPPGELPPEPESPPPPPSWLEPANVWPFVGLQ